jgi:hypothetical protein
VNAAGNAYSQQDRDHDDIREIEGETEQRHTGTSLILLKAATA